MSQDFKMMEQKVPRVRLISWRVVVQMSNFLRNFPPVKKCRSIWDCAGFRNRKKERGECEGRDKEGKGGGMKTRAKNLASVVAFACLNSFS